SPGVIDGSQPPFPGAQMSSMAARLSFLVPRCHRWQSGSLFWCPGVIDGSQTLFSGAQVSSMAVRLSLPESTHKVPLVDTIDRASCPWADQITWRCLFFYSCQAAVKSGNPASATWKWRSSRRHDARSNVVAMASFRILSLEARRGVVSRDQYLSLARVCYRSLLVQCHQMNFVNVGESWIFRLSRPCISGSMPLGHSNADAGWDRSHFAGAN
ncbi:hypothetical protein HII31_02698, partial [Pseudocercospora fuligena]